MPATVEDAEILTALDTIPAGLTIIEQWRQMLGYDHEYVDIDKERNRQAIAKAVRVKRAELGLTQQQLADKSGVTKQTICNIESGNYNASIDVLSYVMAVLGIKMEIC